MTLLNTRAELIDTVIKLTAENGIENVTTKQIAAYLLISEGTIYRYFTSKNDLMSEAFLVVDSRISKLLTGSKYLKGELTVPIKEAAHDVWIKMFRYLITHQDETLYLIRFRYSSLYTDELRARRKSYDGSFDKVYEVIKEYFNVPIYSYNGFIVNYIFEITLSFAEKILTGRIKNSPQFEDTVWEAICSIILKLTERTPENKEVAKETV